MFRLKALREETGAMQKEIASALGIERSLYGKYENERSEPPYSVLAKMADYFGVSTDYLLGRTDKKSPPPEGDELSAEDIETARLISSLPPSLAQAVRDMARQIASGAVPPSGQE